MATPLILLLPAPDSDADALRPRLEALGCRCELTEDPASSMAALPETGPVILLVQQGSPWSPPPLADRAGSPLGGVPVLHLGDPGQPVQEDGYDEIIRLEECLASRISVWSGWSALLRCASPPETAPLGITPAGLPGHKQFMETLGREMKRQDRYDAPLGLVLADIDGLREINSQYGHTSGDRVISAVAGTLKDAVRGTDMVFHYGGDSFALLLTHSTTEATHRAVQRLRSVIAGKFFRGNSEGDAPQPLLKISLSFGCACLPEAGIKEPSALVDAAEAALVAGRAAEPDTTLTHGQS